ncbi:hypothetical protein [Burkholderia vietnamiensis]|uniref:hypothetical protein n=1 Tax=Burkholderia vietnamiensis TaxID=60552 RepID=UPI000B188F88|nr:hypothetical protein [Burkholderia vietnamiensis]
MRNPNLRDWQMYGHDQRAEPRKRRPRSEYWEDVREILAILGILLIFLGGFGSLAVAFGWEWETVGPICLGIVALVGYCAWPRYPR